MSGSCCAKGDEVMILACSGGSNVGQLTNQAAVELTREGFGKMFCLAGIGGGLKGFVKSAQGTPRVVVLDGCPVGCAKAILEREEIPLKSYIVVTDLGIEKNKDRQLAVNDEDLAKVKVAGKAAASLNNETSRPSCCGSGKSC
ncbi:putative zinc-binding protein [Fundidesulfovibrio terrae]|uniref:putative zinc-binding protein n=1 Tax=Fundidesulfovibrio terrae TaxID=2922866 RepID=UPI001FAE7627|nr:putative zinc-binding protein [Fundidesulfovibrio terrae]